MKVELRLCQFLEVGLGHLLSCCQSPKMGWFWDEVKQFWAFDFLTLESGLYLSWVFTCDADGSEGVVHMLYQNLLELEMGELRDKH